MVLNNTLGIQVARNGLKPALVESIDENWVIMKKTALTNIPIAKCTPPPPLFLVEAIQTPIMVRIKQAKGVAVLLCNSIYKAFKVSLPLSFSCYI